MCFFSFGKFISPIGQFNCYSQQILKQVEKVSFAFTFKLTLFIAKFSRVEGNKAFRNKDRG